MPPGIEQKVEFSSLRSGRESHAPSQVVEDWADDPIPSDPTPEGTGLELLSDQVAQLDFALGLLLDPDDTPNIDPEGRMRANLTMLSDLKSAVIDNAADQLGASERLTDLVTSVEDLGARFDAALPALIAELVDRLRGAELGPAIADTQALIAQLDSELKAATASQASMITQAAEQTEKSLSALLASQESVAGKLNALPDSASAVQDALGPVHSDFVEHIARIEAQVKDLSERPAPVPDMSQSHAALGQIAASVSRAISGQDALRGVVEASTKAIKTQLGDRFAASDGTLHKVLESAQQIGADQGQQVVALKDELARIGTRLDAGRAQSDEAVMKAAQAAADAVVAPLNGALAKGELRAQEILDALQNASTHLRSEILDASQSLKRLEAFGTDTRRKGARRAAECMSAILARFDTLESQIEATSTAVRDLPTTSTDDLSGLHSQLDLVLEKIEEDLPETVRQSAARVEFSEISNAVKTLAQDMAALKAHQERNGSNDASMLSSVAAQSFEMLELMRSSPAQMKQASLDALAQITDTLEHIKTGIDTAVSRPAPLPDLSGIHDAIARQATAVSQGLARQDALIAAGFSTFKETATELMQPSDAETSDAIAAIADAVSNLASRVDAVHLCVSEGPSLASLNEGLEKHITAVSSGLQRQNEAATRLFDKVTSLEQHLDHAQHIEASVSGADAAALTAIETRLSTLETAITRLAERPLPTPDMTGIQNSIARLSAAMSNGLARQEAILETLVGTLSQSRPEMDGVEVSSAQPITQTDNPMIEGKLDAVVEQLGALPASISDAERNLRFASAEILARLVQEMSFPSAEKQG